MYPYKKGMVQTKAGASSNAWIKFHRECAKRFKEEQAASPSHNGQVKAPVKAPMKTRNKAASPTNAQKTRR